MLQIKNLNKSFGVGELRTEILHDISLDVRKGEIVTVLGASGSGKSTLLNVVGGITDADSGEISVDGEFITQMDSKALSLYRRRQVGYVFQRYNLINKLTVRENIETGAYLSQNPLDVSEIVRGLALEGHEEKFPRELSGGQQQRCAIGRAIVKRPRLLLCDEPTGALDYKTSKNILALLVDLNRRYHITEIIVTHNREMARLGDRIVEIKDGRILRVEENTRVPVPELSW